MRVGALSILLPSESVLDHVNEHVESAKSKLRDLINGGEIRSADEQMLVYRITDAHRAYTGIVLAVDIGAFQSPSIVHHELTIPDKVEKQARIAGEQHGFSKPILLTHHAIPAIEQILQKIVLRQADISLYLDRYQAKHELWYIQSDNDRKTIINCYKDIKNAYIVDGHHRTEAIKLLANEAKYDIRHGLSAFFSVDQLKIQPFHRVIELKDSFDVNEFIKSLSEYGTVRPVERARFPKKEHEMVFLFKNRSFIFNWDQSVFQAFDGAKCLDVSLLSKFIIKDILHIQSERNSPHVGYIEGVISIKSMKKQLRKSTKMIVLLYPLDIEDMIKITTDGILLPPKSTYFLPRMANGIIGMEIKEL